jgi:glycosyltransferase involved in cell wall biosynthesis
VSAAALLVALALAVGPPVRVGSKKFTESVLLGDITTGAIEGAGVAAVHWSALGGTRILWSALQRGDVDVYPDYTGTVWREILGRSGQVDGEALRRGLAERGVAMTRSLGFDDSYAVAMRPDRAAALGLRSISDLARHPELRLAFTNEFLDRADGWPALRDRYRLPQREVRGLDHDVAYRTRIILRGNGNQAGLLKAEIAQRDLANITVEDLLPPDQLWQGLARGDIHLVPQDPAAAAFAMPSKVFNIMAAGRPFVATAAVGSPLWRLHAESGAFLCAPPNDATAFTDAVLRLVEDSQLRRRLGANGRHFVERHYSKAHVLEKLLRRIATLHAEA